MNDLQSKSKHSMQLLAILVKLQVLRILSTFSKYYKIALGLLVYYDSQPFIGGIIESICS
jgi:hypothetical protein